MFVLQRLIQLSCSAVASSEILPQCRIARASSWLSSKSHGPMRVLLSGPIKCTDQYWLDWILTRTRGIRSPSHRPDRLPEQVERDAALEYFVGQVSALLSTSRTCRNNPRRW